MTKKELKAELEKGRAYIAAIEDELSSMLTEKLQLKAQLLVEKQARQKAEERAARN